MIENGERNHRLVYDCEIAYIFLFGGLFAFGWLEHVRYLEFVLLFLDLNLSLLYHGHNLIIYVYMCILYTIELFEVIYFMN